jgi:hypothetical protein
MFQVVICVSEVLLCEISGYHGDEDDSVAMKGRQYFSLKRWCLPTSLYGVTTR